MDQLLEELNIHPSQSELELTIRYRDIEVLNGVRLSPSEVSQPPTVEIHPSSSASADEQLLYCLALVDADSQPRSRYYMYPTVADPTREWLCWCRANLVAQDPEASGITLCSYMGPKPVISEHRYIFMLWEQMDPITEPEDSHKCKRANWKHEQFARVHGLSCVPVALKYFVSSPEATARSSISPY